MKAPARILVALLCALSIVEARADHFVLNRLVDATTPVPGTSATFTDFTILPPSIHRGSIAFSSMTGKVGVYLYQDGEVLTVADSLSNLPGTAAPLEAYRAENIEVRDGGVAFIGWAAGQPGIYLGDGKGSLRRITGAGTNVPGTSAIIQSIGYLSLDGSNMAFSINGYGYFVGNDFTNYTDANGIYTVIDGVLKRVVDPTTPLPNGGGTFGTFDQLSMNGDEILFMGGGNSSYGIHKAVSGGVSTILQGGSTLPGTETAINGFADISFRQDAVGFRGLILNTMDSAVVRYYDGNMSIVAEPGTVANANGDTFVGLFSLGFDGGNLAFLASTKDARGTVKPTALFAQAGGGYQRAVGIGDVVDGRTVQQILFGYHGVSGNSLAFFLRFTDSSLALYRADLVLDEIVTVTEDLDGDARSNQAYYDPATGTWYERFGSGIFKTRQFGFPGTLPVAGDYDGDHLADIGVYEPQTGIWYLLMSRDGFITLQFGYPGVVPAPADYDGDGATDLAVFNPASGWWYILATTERFRTLQFGYAGVQAVPADFDNDGRADIAVFEEAHGLWYVLGSAGQFGITQFGYPGVTPVVADFDGQGADFAVFDSRDGNWYSHGQVDGFQLRQFGYNGVRPVSADYDGDTKSDLGVYDPYRARWYLLRTSAGFRAGGL